MKLKLPITLVAVDCVTPLETLKSIKYTLKSVEFEKIVLVTATGWGYMHLGYLLELKETMPIRIVESQQGGRLDYEDFVLRKLHTCFDTPHCLFMEWDSGVVNPAAWNPEWYDYDYIGAPWHYPADCEKGYPPCTSENCVGNGGFSLRSKIFCEEMASLMPEGEPNIDLSDVYACRTRRDELEERNIEFAPFDIAERFSCENRFYSGQFGFHGRNTIAMNGWKWDLR